MGLGREKELLDAITTQHIMSRRKSIREVQKKAGDFVVYHPILSINH